MRDGVDDGVGMSATRDPEDRGRDRGERETEKKKRTRDDVRCKR